MLDTKNVLPNNSTKLLTKSNIAVNIGRKYGIATQDSVEYGGEASRAVDGNTNGVFRK